MAMTAIICIMSTFEETWRVYKPSRKREFAKEVGTGVNYLSSISTGNTKGGNRLRKDILRASGCSFITVSEAQSSRVSSEAAKDGQHDNHMTTT